MYLLDTNHCSRLIDRDPETIRRLARLGQASIATSVIAEGVLHLMVELSEQKASNRRKVRSFLDDITVLPVDSSIAEIYGSIKSRLILPKFDSRIGFQTYRMHEFVLNVLVFFVADHLCSFAALR